MAKAFDTVWHDGLVCKIFNHYNLPILTKKLLSNFLTNRHYQIILNNAYSKTFSSKAGVPQGSVLSPLLYILYTNDTPQSIHRNTEYFQYADDVTVLTHSNAYTQLNNIINKELDNINLYQSKWLINSNMDKSAIVLYKQSPSRINNYNPILVNNKIIPLKTKTSIFGVEFDSKLILKNHITFRYDYALNTLQKLKRFQDLSTNIQFYLFQMLCQSQLLFSPTALIFPPKLGIQKSQILQNKAIKQIHKIHWTDYKKNKDLHNELNITPTTGKIYDRFCRVHYKLLNQANHTQEKLLRNINRHSRFSTLLANPPECFLDQ